LEEFQRRREALARQDAREARADQERLEELQRQRSSLQAQLASLQAIRDLAAGVRDIQPSQDFSFQRVVNQETGVDFLAVAARTLMTQGTGGL
jgi:hypothetical protein